MISHEELLDILRYDPSVGAFVRLKTRSNRAAGTIAGWKCPSNGYPHIEINGKKYAQHRLAFFYVTGRWPTHQIDHKDGDRTNNRWENLREATRSQNGANKKTKGYRLHVCGKWTAEICFRKKRIYLGLFSTEEAAREAYEAKARELFGEFARAS